MTFTLKEKNDQAEFYIAMTNFSIKAWAQCYKTFYGRKLSLFIISQSVCPWKAFPA